MTDIVQEHWDQVQTELDQERQRSADLLADSKRHEATANERLQVIEQFDECTGEVAIRQELVRLRLQNETLKRDVKNALAEQASW